jgi:hypothetical protein
MRKYNYYWFKAESHKPCRIKVTFYWNTALSTRLRGRQMGVAMVQCQTKVLGEEFLIL